MGFIGEFWPGCATIESINISRGGAGLSQMRGTKNMLKRWSFPVYTGKPEPGLPFEGVATLVNVSQATKKKSAYRRMARGLVVVSDTRAAAAALPSLLGGCGLQAGWDGAMNKRRTQQKYTDTQNTTDC